MRLAAHRYWPRVASSLVVGVVLAAGVAACQGDQAWTAYTVEDGLAHDAVESVATGPDGVVWAATHAGVSRVDGQEWTTYTSQDAPIDSRIHDLATGADGEVWVGSGKGVASYDGEQWTRHDGLPDWPVTAITVIDEGEVLAVSDGVYRSDGQRWRRVEGSPHQQVGSLAVADDGTVWMAPTTVIDGEALFEFEGQEWTDHVTRENADITSDHADGEVVPGRVVRDLEVADGALWAGTDEGLASYEYGTWSRHVVDDGLPQGGVQALTVDRDGDVWLAIAEEDATDPEYAVAHFDGQRWNSYTTADGLPDGRINDLTVDDDGTVWAATSAGLASFHADDPA